MSFSGLRLRSNSAWVKDEAAEARDFERLVPVSIGSAKPPLGFRQFHTIDLGSWTGHGLPEALDEMLSAIDRTCGSVEHGEKAIGKAAVEGAQPKASICVLPFANMSGEPEQEYFSDGITEDIITDLSKVSALSVIARNTAFGFKGRNPDVKEVAQNLGVSHVLEGSVRKVANRVRITAQLINGSKGDHVWADRYDRDLTDIFEIQDEISKAIVEALKLKLLPAEKKAIENRGTSNVDAYDLYLMARQQWISGTFGTVRREQSIARLCREAAQLDTEYAQAWALLGLAQLELRFVHGYSEDALSSAERALEINPALAEAHCIRARYLEEEGRTEQAEKQVRTALKLDPESWEVNREAGRMLFRHGHIREAIPHFEKAASLNDTDWHNPLMLVTCYKSFGEDEKMRKAARTGSERAERAITQDATNGSALASGAICLELLGEVERSREWIQRAMLLDPDNLNMRYNVACSFALSDDTNEAIDTLGPWFEVVNSATRIRHAEADPDFDSLRDDPRFKEMLAAAKKRLGMLGDAGAALPR